MLYKQQKNKSVIPMSSPYTKHGNNAITSLRGIFIIMIVLHHLGLYSGGGTLGVAFFFMLGGLTLSLGYYERVCRPDFEYSQYIRRRCENQRNRRRQDSCGSIHTKRTIAPEPNPHKIHILLIQCRLVVFEFRHDTRHTLPLHRQKSR